MWIYHWKISSAKHQVWRKWWQNLHFVWAIPLKTRSESLADPASIAAPLLKKDLMIRRNLNSCASTPWLTSSVLLSICMTPPAPGLLFLWHMHIPHVPALSNRRSAAGFSASARMLKINSVMKMFTLIHYMISHKIRWRHIYPVVRRCIFTDV